MLKKTPFIIGLSMIVQSFTFLFLFIIMITDRKKRNVSWAALALSSVSAIGGSLLAYAQIRDELKNDRVAKAMESLSALDEEAEEVEVIVKPAKPFIPVDDTVNEDEFK